MILADALVRSQVEARAIDVIGTQGIIDKIRKTVGDTPCYLCQSPLISVTEEARLTVRGTAIDIDVLDPSAAPATGTPETGENIQIG